MHRVTERREFWALLDQTVVSATNFVTNLLVANFCVPKEYFAIYFLGLSLAHFLRGTQEQLVSTPYTVYWHRRDSSQRAHYRGSSLAHQLIWTVTATLGLAVVAICLQTADASNDLTGAINGLLIVLPFFLFREFIRKLLFAHFQFRQALALDIVVAVVQLTCMAIAIYLGKLSVTLTWACTAMACIAAGHAWVRRFRGELQWNWEAIRKDWTQNWQFGRWALVTHVLGCSIPYFMPWLVEFLRGSSETALYAASMTIVGLANMLLTGVSNFLSPTSAHAFTTGGTRQLLRSLLQAAAVIVAILGPFCLLIGFAGNDIAQRAFPDEYTGLAVPMLFLAISLLASGLGMVAGNGLCAMERPALNIVADVLCLVGSVGLGILWIPDRGARGAAAAVMAAALLTAITRWLILGNLVASPRGEGRRP